MLSNTEAISWATFDLLLLSLRLDGEGTLKYRCVWCPRAEKFNIVSNDHGHTQNGDFYVLYRK